MARPDGGSPVPPDEHEHAGEYGGFDREDDPDVPGHAARFDASFRPKAEVTRFVHWGARKVGALCFPNSVFGREHDAYQMHIRRKIKATRKRRPWDRDKPMRECHTGVTTSCKDLSVVVQSRRVIRSRPGD